MKRILAYKAKICFWPIFFGQWPNVKRNWSGRVRLESSGRKMESRFKPGFRFPAGTDQTDTSRPVSFKIWPLAKSAKSQKADFCFIGEYLFMGPSWVEALGLIFGKVYIVWVCAPHYRPLSCRRNRIREKRTSKFGPNFVILIFCMYIYIYILELDCTYPCAGLSGIVTACWLRSNCRLDPRGSKQMIKSQPKNHCKNELELNVTSTQHQAKHEPKNSTKFEPTSAQNRSKI